MESETWVIGSRSLKNKDLWVRYCGIRSYVRNYQLHNPSGKTARLLCGMLGWQFREGPNSPRFSWASITRSTARTMESSPRRQLGSESKTGGVWELSMCRILPKKATTGNRVFT